MATSKGHSLKDIDKVLKMTRKSIKNSITVQKQENKEIIALTKQLMSKISNEGLRRGEIGPASQIMDIVQEHLQEKIDYLNSSENFKNEKEIQYEKYDSKLEKRSQTRSQTRTKTRLSPKTNKTRKCTIQG